MKRSAQWNFAARLVERLGHGSELLDAPSGERFAAAELGAAITDFAATFAAAGLRHGDRVLQPENRGAIGRSVHVRGNH